MSYQIITDSCCDLTEAQLQQLQVSCANLTVLYKGENHRNFSEPAAVKAFYDELREGITATTAAANPDDWATLMLPALKEGRDVLVIAFSSGLSTTYQSAVIAAKDLQEEFPDRTINVVDSLCAALGQGLLVYHACRKRDEGMTIGDLTAWLEDLTNCAKVRGRKAAMEYLAKQFAETSTDFDTVFIGHGDCPEDAAALEALLREKHEIKEITTGYVGPVIGAHTGPGVLVVFFMGTQR